MSQSAPEPTPKPIDQDAIEDWRLLRDVLEERDREWWAENESEDE